MSADEHRVSRRLPVTTLHPNGPIPGWARRPGPPSALRDAPCQRAAPGVFDPLPSIIGMGKRQKEDRARGIAYAARYCDGTDTRPACPHRERCLIWALEAKERVVAGGVEVTAGMIARYHKAKKESDRAAEAQASEDRTRQLAERPGSDRGEPDQGTG